MQHYGRKKVIYYTTSLYVYKFHFRVANDNIQNIAGGCSQSKEVNIGDDHNLLRRKKYVIISDKHSVRNT